MQYRNDIVTFFETHDIIPGKNEIISYKAYLLILFDALSKDDALYRFMIEAFVPTNNGQMKLDLDSWQELMSCYIHFITGYTKDKQSYVM